MMVLRNLNVSAILTAEPLISRGRDGEGTLPEVNHHLHGFDSVQLQVIVTAPDHHPVNLSPVHGRRWRQGCLGWCHLLLDRRIFGDRVTRGEGRARSPAALPC
ncbi:hypothetical protein J4Q44_G00049480 [Coregonus suidteri]|uniref:Uncharacterized protein n=1 Tax=Coregonus suidteri TaxID=861788 RepID=A0AAN8NE71_9TELE